MKSEWIGKWWIRIWDSQAKVIEIGLGRPAIETGGYYMHQVRTRSWGPFWISVARPNLEWIHKGLP